MKYKCFIDYWNSLTDQQKVDLFNVHYAGVDATLYLKDCILKELYYDSLSNKETLVNFLKMWFNSTQLNFDNDPTKKYYLMDYYYETVVTFDEFEPEFFEYMQGLFEENFDLYFG